MTYRLSYDDGVPISVKKWRNERSARTETFGTEREALKRAAQLLNDGTTLLWSAKAPATLSAAFDCN
jgi:hypothetical protein